MPADTRACVVGVDGGGSKTTAAVADTGGVILGTGHSGGSNYVRTGIAAAAERIGQAVETALEQAGRRAEDVIGIQYALAGADRREDLDILEPALACLPYRNGQVVCDTAAGLRSGSPDNTGVVLICGFGTNAAGRNAAGEMVQVGGFGAFYGDYAGGNALAGRTFQAAIRSWDGRERPSTLVEAVARFHGVVAGMGAVVDHYLANGIARVPHELAIVAHEEAEKGDPLAIGLLQELGRELGKAANAVIGRMNGFDGAAFPVVLVGSVLQKGRSPHVLDELASRVKSFCDRAEIVLPAVEPVVGSVRLAMDRLGLKADENNIRNQAHSALGEKKNDH